MPDYEEDLVYVDFHPIERLLHNGAVLIKIYYTNNPYLTLFFVPLEGTPASNLELCGGVIPNNSTLDGVASKTIEDAQNKRTYLLNSIANMKQALEAEENQKGQTGHKGGYLWFYHYPERIKTAEQDIRGLDAEIAKWTSVDKVLDGRDITDPVVHAELTLVNNYGSKMARLINWLKDNMEEDEGNRFILFSKVGVVTRSNFINAN